MTLGIDEKAFQDAPKASDQDFTPLPDGKYLAVIEESDIRQNKKSNGEHWAMKLRVRGGEFKNRVIFNNQNISNHPIALTYLKNALEAVKYTGSINDLDQTAPNFVGVVVVVKISNYTKNSEQRQNITLFEVDTETKGHAITAITDLAAKKNVDLNTGLQHEFPGKALAALTFTELMTVKEKLDEGTFGITTVEGAAPTPAPAKEQKFYF